MSRAVGIDLGTTNSCVAVYEDRQARVLTNAKGSPLIPSCVAFNNEIVLVGDKAVNYEDKKDVVYGVKRIIGRKYDDAQAVKVKSNWPFTFINRLDMAYIQVNYKGGNLLLLAEEISAFVLDELKTIAKQRLKTESISAVITVPTYFSPKRRAATEDAARMAGITVLQLINESTAAAIAYGVLKGQSFFWNRRVLVFDLGGGTLDITIVDIQRRNFTVKGHSGFLYLGGEDFTKNLADYLEQDIKTANAAHELNENFKAEIRRKAEKAKKALSFERIVSVDLQRDNISYHTNIPRSQFTELNQELFNRAERCVNDALSNAGSTTEQIDDVVIVGGSLNIPYFGQMLETKFGETKIRRSADCYDELVAKGAAILASYLSGEKNTGIGWLRFTDVTPLSLGTDVVEDRTSFIIPRQTKLPARNAKSYENVEDGAREISIQICQGEHERFSQNDLVGHFAIALSEGRKKQVDVTFHLNESGLLRASAEEKKGKNKRVIEIDLAERLKEAEINERKRQLIEMKCHNETLNNEVEAMENARHELRDFVRRVRQRCNNATVQDKCNKIDAYIQQIARNGKEVNSVALAKQLELAYKREKKELKDLEQQLQSVEELGGVFQEHVLRD